MITVEHEEVIKDSDEEKFDELHVVCIECNPDLGYCGTDLTGHDWHPSYAPATCVVCDAMEVRGCPTCGN